MESYVNGTTRQLSESDGRRLGADITEAEVRAAIGGLERHKSPGPDQLPNDFYLDNIDVLAAPLAQLYQRCWDTGEYPDGHREATIFAVPKGQTSDDPMRYRPLAMLNTDYKILAKVLATRLRSVVRTLVHDDQHAFVPGRTIHEAIDVLMLDFAKAYDSIERDYMTAVLREMRLPERLLQFVQQTHQDTTVRFLVNGGLSRAVPVTRGIRQGCPLAPMLFILGLEPLIHRVTTHPDLDGIQLEVLNERKTVSLVAYADDTTIYLERASQLGNVRHLLDDFAVHSGLQINVTKSLVVPLIREWTATAIDTDFTVLDNATSVRYLGVQVRHGIDADAT